MEEQILKLINKIAGVGVTLTVAIVAAAVLLLGHPTETAEAGALGSIELSCTPATQAAAIGNQVTCSFRFDEAATYAAAEDVDGVSVTLTTTLGTWAANGATSITFDCGNVGSVVADTCEADTLTFLLDVGTATGTNTVVISAGTAVDTFAVSLTAAAGSGAADSISYFTKDKDAIGYATTGFAPINQATTIRFRVLDVNGLGLNDQLVTFSTDNGVLDASGGACTGTLSSTLTASTAAYSVYQGTSSIELCAKSTAGVGVTATVTATVVSKPTLTADTTVSISKKPASADISVTLDGTVISVEVFQDGLPAPDDTDIRFQVVPTTDAAITAPCVALHDGLAESEIAVASGKTVTLLVTATESATSCAGVPVRGYGSAQVQVSADDVTAADDAAADDAAADDAAADDAAADDAAADDAAADDAAAEATPATAPEPPAGGQSQVVMTQDDLTVFLGANTWVESVTFFDFGEQKYLFCHIDGAPAFAVDTCTLSAGSILGLTAK
jgi:hypothetical protein